MNVSSTKESNICKWFAKEKYVQVEIHAYTCSSKSMVEDLRVGTLSNISRFCGRATGIWLRVGLPCQAKLVAWPCKQHFSEYCAHPTNIACLEKPYLDRWCCECKLVVTSHGPTSSSSQPQDVPPPTSPPHHLPWQPP